MFDACSSLIELLRIRKDESETGITFINELDERFISYKDLYETSLKYLHSLQNEGLNPGDEVVFQIDNNQHFVFYFWACVLGGLIPVPVSVSANEEHRLKLIKIWKLLKNPYLITSQKFMEKLEKFFEKVDMNDEIANLKNKTIYINEDIEKGQFGMIHKAEPEDIALIQFSSGSTGNPKGVIITHKNVLINLTAAIESAQITNSDRSLNWMPLTHDMGLIGTHIKSILAGIKQYNMQTQLFIRQPKLWMKKASEHKISLLYSPNFGYKHYLKFHKEDENKDLDLSQVRLIFNGAEPISADLCEEFLQKMKVHGLKSNSMYPVYGLAEGTIAVTFPKPGDDYRKISLKRNNLKVGSYVEESGKDDSNSITFVDVGYPLGNCYLKICDENNKQLEENKIGHIFLKGGNVTSGYYNDREATNKSINSDGWLDTGDLGFLHNGRLVITGRSKDVIFMVGQNYYSHDIERICEAVEEVELGKVVAVGVFNEIDQSDELIIFVFFKKKLDLFIQIVKEIRNIINEQLGIEVSQVIPVKSIPKTTSGKVQRYLLREMYLDGEFTEKIDEIQKLKQKGNCDKRIITSKGEIEKELSDIVRSFFGIGTIGREDIFFDYGGNSLLLIRVQEKLEEIYPGCVSTSILFANPTVSKLASYIENELNTKKFDNSKSLGTDMEKELNTLFDEIGAGKIDIDQMLEKIKNI